MAGGPHFDIDDDELEDNHEINVVPFIDVALVLLVIFMVAAPIATIDLDVDLPQSSMNAAEDTAAPEPAPVYVTLDAAGVLVIAGQEATASSLQAALDAATQEDRERRIHLRADRSVSYGSVMEAMDRLRAAGYHRLALVGRPASD